MEVKKDIRVVQLPLFEVEITYFRDTLKAILHTIFFHRVLGPVSPLDVTIDTLDITYVSLIITQITQQFYLIYYYSKGKV